MSSEIKYLNGFSNQHATEFVNQALPIGQNNPQCHPLKLITEQISGSAFTQVRNCNLHSWLYRRRPSASLITDYKPYPCKLDFKLIEAQPPLPYRWNPINNSIAKNADCFFDQLFFICQQPTAKIFFYQINQSNPSNYYINHDAELLLIAQNGQLSIHTEFGKLELAPYEILVIPRGCYFKINLFATQALGFLCENHGLPFQLPELGIIGANGLANPLDFLYPVAHPEEELKKPAKVIAKHMDKFWEANTPYTPLNVLAWKGNYAPYKYNLLNFNTINTVSFDHLDPSIFTVLTSPSVQSNTAAVDFAIFPERWAVAENTFRPPYFHKNIMSEFMGLLKGQYDAKNADFEVGGFSLHNQMIAHGPDKQSYDKAIKSTLKPEKYQDTLAFMLESCQIWQISQQAYDNKARQPAYTQCWQGF